MQPFCLLRIFWLSSAEDFLENPAWFFGVPLFCATFATKMKQNKTKINLLFDLKAILP